MRIRTVLISLTLFIGSSSYAAASADFSFDYDVAYQVAESGTTHVRQNITITNETSQYYPRNYTLTVSANSIANVTARDNSGPITPEVTSTSNESTISLTFNTIAAGIHKQLPFTLEYDVDDIASKKGTIWEIIIPGTEKNEDINSYTIRLLTPESFGTGAYFSPPKQSPDFVWEWSEHGGRGISAAFGKVQNFTFELHYHLANDSSQNQIQEITWPPDTAFQKVIIATSSEKPETVRVDRDGNWLASFSVPANSEKEIAVSGTAYVYIKPQSGFEQQLTSQERTLYTSSQPFWDQSDEIRAKGEELGSAERIYNFVVSHLNYDYSRIEPGIERLGAGTAFNYPDRSVCMEFSDLFVALARAAGIPAREIHGFAYTTNSRLQPLSLGADILHAWAEYYDSERQLWIPVDPTWGNTTHGVDYFHQLDFNHVAFAILGSESDYPYPAGAFRTENSKKDVFIKFTDTETVVPEPEFLLKFPASLTAISGFTTAIPVTVVNSGGVRLPTLTLAARDFSAEATLPTPLPPFASVTVPLHVKPQLQWLSRKFPLTVLVGEREFTTNLTILPFYHILIFPTLGVGIVIAGFGILMVHGKRKSVH